MAVTPSIASGANQFFPTTIQFHRQNKSGKNVVSNKSLVLRMGLGKQCLDTVKGKLSK